MLLQIFSLVSVVVGAMKISQYYLFGEINNLGVLFSGFISVSI